MAKVMTIRPPEELKKALMKIAEKQGLTINALVIQMLWESVDRRRDDRRR